MFISLTLECVCLFVSFCTYLPACQLHTHISVRSTVQDGNSQTSTALVADALMTSAHSFTNTDEKASDACRPVCTI